jgi:hypothetical protein
MNAEVKTGMIVSERLIAGSRLRADEGVEEGLWGIDVSPVPCDF